LAGGLIAQIRDSSRQQQENECEDAVTTAAMRTCEAVRYEIAQRELNAAYQKLMEHLHSGQKKRNCALRSVLGFATGMLRRLSRPAWYRVAPGSSDEDQQSYGK